MDRVQYDVLDVVPLGSRTCNLVSTSAGFLLLRVEVPGMANGPSHRTIEHHIALSLIYRRLTIAEILSQVIFNS
jgi:hypothetical protein